MKGFATILWMMIAATAWAQSPHCGTPHFPAKPLLTPHLRTDSMPTSGPVTIPVVVHILWHTPEENLSDAVILSQIEALNRDFSGGNEDLQYVPDEFVPAIGRSDLRFCLAARDSNGQPTTAITRRYTAQPEFGTTDSWYSSTEGGTAAWNPDHYLNIWVVDIGDFITGFATYPETQDLPYTGVVIHPKYFGVNASKNFGLGRVATHEVGHFLGLRHPWGDDTQCETDDGIADTPPQLTAHGGCPSYPQAGCSPSEMFMNFMDYVNDPCMFMFTQGQQDHMRETLLLARAPLSNGCIPCQVPGAPTLGLTPYPNPTTSTVQVRFDTAPMRLVPYSLFNQLGQVKIQGEQLVNEALTLDLSRLAAGTYYLSAEGRVAKIIKR